MFDFKSKKKKILIIVALIIAVALFVVIINYDKFESFFSKVVDFISVLSPIFIGIAIAYILAPLERFFSRRVLKKMKTGKWHKFMSIFLTYFTVIGFITVFCLITIPQLLKSIADLPPRVHAFVDELQLAFNGLISRIESSEFYKSLSSTLGLEIFNLRDFFGSIVNGFVNIESLVNDLGDHMVDFFKELYSFAANSLIGFVLSIYLLAAKARLSAQGKMLLHAAFSEEKAHRILGIVKFSDKTFGSFIQGKIINSIITGLICSVFFAIFGLPYSQLLAFIVGVTDIIPVFGPFIGGIPCFFLVLIAAPEKLIIFLVLLILIQQIDANYIAPKILGESTGLSSLGVFVAILVMGGYFNLIGMIIGIPLVAIIVALVTKSVQKKLVARGLSPDIADYYYKHSDDLSINERDSFFKRIVNVAIRGSKKLLSFIKKIFSRKNKNKENNSSDGDQTNDQ